MAQQKGWGARGANPGVKGVRPRVLGESEPREVHLSNVGKRRVGGGGSEQDPTARFCTGLTRTGVTDRGEMVASRERHGGPMK